MIDIINKLAIIENNILVWYIKEYPLFKNSFISQIKLIKNIEYEYTNSGIFVSFLLENTNYIKVSKDLFKSYNRLDGLCIESKELSSGVSPISLELDDDGRIKYIELEFGFIKKSYPMKYKLIDCYSNCIIDNEYESK